MRNLEIIKLIASSLVLVCISNVIDAAPSDNGMLTLRIIHTNDMHSRFEEVSQLSGICTKRDAEKNICYGGFARMTTLVREARESAAAKDLPLLFLNAGDTYQGTKLYSYYKWRIVAKFMNILKPDAMSLGNHEFDDGVAGLLPFLNNITFPVVTANLDLSAEPDLAQAKQLKNSTVMVMKNKKIGIIGYLTGETKTLSNTDKVEFIDEVVAIREEAKKLKAEGVDILIAVGHSGFEMDKKIAREVEDLDLVIGGHTNTFLYNGKQPDTEKIEGMYPTVIDQASGRKVYVVQAYAYTKYLGDIEMDFDGNGEITRIKGQPILVDSSVKKAEDVETELKKWTEPLQNITSEVVGIAKVLLQGDEKTCKLRECNFGNLLTDAMIHYNAKIFTGDNGWTDAPIAIHQAGGIRSSVDSLVDDTVTMDDIITAFPFGTKVFKVQMKGDLLWKVLEWSVHDRLSQNVTQHGGSFLQVSGLRVVYNISQPFNSRVISAKARCNLCIIPIYRDIKMDSSYSVLIPDFLHNGGDGYDMLKEIPYENLNVTDVDVVVEYIRQMTPVYPEIEGRILVLAGTDQPVSTPSTFKNSAAMTMTHYVPILLAVFTYFASFLLL